MKKTTSKVMKKTTSLIVIADAQTARIFEKTGEKKFDLNLLCELEAELDSNHEKPGRTFNSTSGVKHGIAPHTDRRQVEKHKFAEQISKKLFELDKAAKFDNLVLIASHKVLKEIENTLSNALNKKTSKKLAKDLIEYTKKELKEFLEKNLS